MTMHRQQERQMQLPSKDKESATRMDLLTDRMMDNIISMTRTTHPSLGAESAHISQDLLSSMHQEMNSSADDFAEFQSCPKTWDNATTVPNGCSTDDFDNFVTASKPQAGSRTVVDRYDVFRELDPGAQTTDVMNVSGHASDERIVLWQKCLTACKQLLHKSFNALIVNHGEESAIEALRSEPGSRFVEDLHQVYYMSQRIGSAIRSSSPNTSLPLLHTLSADIEMTWRPLRLLFKKVTKHLASTPESEIRKAGGEQCYICLNGEPPELTFVQATPYHASCANLVVHYLQSRLPVPS